MVGPGAGHPAPDHSEVVAGPRQPGGHRVPGVPPALPRAHLRQDVARGLSALRVRGVADVKEDTWNDVLSSGDFVLPYSFVFSADNFLQTCDILLLCYYYNLYCFIMPILLIFLRLFIILILLRFYSLTLLNKLLTKQRLTLKNTKIFEV